LEEPTSLFHTCLEGKVVEEIRNSPSAEEGLSAGATSCGVVVLASEILTLAAAFFFVFPAAGVGRAGDLFSGFLGPVAFLVSVTLGWLGNSVTG
jgi:hypothetical protein